MYLRGLRQNPVEIEEACCYATRQHSLAHNLTFSESGETRHTDEQMRPSRIGRKSGKSSSDAGLAVETVHESG
jgi:hypothetical protein